MRRASPRERLPAAEYGQGPAETPGWLDNRQDQCGTGGFRRTWQTRRAAQPTHRGAYLPIADAATVTQSS